MQDQNEDTEWNDILRQQGVIPERPKSPTAEIEAAMEEAVEKAHANRLEGKSIKELDELDEDGLEDEDFLQFYREKRMNEIREQASREKFGEVVYINKSEYKDEVTEASKSYFVILHIASSQSVQSRLLHGLLLRVAPRFRDVKFVEIASSQINEKYPDSQTPTILVYRNTQVVHQQVTLALIGGNSTNVRDIDNLLVKAKVVPRTDPRLLENQDDRSESD